MQVFYRPEQSVTVQSGSPSAGKPAQVVADWRERFGITVSPTSGFYNAGCRYAGGCCAFNGLVLALLILGMYCE